MTGYGAAKQQPAKHAAQRRRQFTTSLATAQRTRLSDEKCAHDLVEEATGSNTYSLQKTATSSSRSSRPPRGGSPLSFHDSRRRTKPTRDAPPCKTTPCATYATHIPSSPTLEHHHEQHTPSRASYALDQSAHIATLVLQAWHEGLATATWSTTHERT